MKGSLHWDVDTVISVNTKAYAAKSAGRNAEGSLCAVVGANDGAASAPYGSAAMIVDVTTIVNESVTEVQMRMRS